MNVSYMLFQAERSRSAAERRAEATRSGEIAMALSRLLRRRSHREEPARSARPALTLVGCPAAAVPPPRAASRYECGTAC